MLKYADNDTMCESLLQEAHDTMLDVLRYVNDSMMQMSIIGFDVSHSFIYCLYYIS